MQEDYRKFLELSKILEESKKCKYCKEQSLVHCDYMEHYLMCSKCGKIFKYNEKTNILEYVGFCTNEDDIYVGKASNLNKGS